MIVYELLDEFLNENSKSKISKSLLERDELLKGGKSENLNSEDVDPDQLEIGIAVEMEHTDLPEISLEIALDHLSENPTYYTELIQAGLVDEPNAIEIYNKLIGDDLNEY